MEDLPADQQEASAAAFRFLVTSGGTKIALTPATVRVLGRSGVRPGAGTRAPRGQTYPAARRSAGARRTGWAGSARYELFHDVLCDAVLEWRGRYEAEQERQKLRRRLEDKEERRLAEAEEAHGSAKPISSAPPGSGSSPSWWRSPGGRLGAAERGDASGERERAPSEALAASAIGKLEVDPELSVLLAQAAWRTARQRS